MLTLQDLQAISRKAETDSELLKIEQRTINTLVHPLLDALGYDHSNPREVAAELVAGTGTSTSEKVDYAIMRDGKPIILLECKPLGNSLGSMEINQLIGYFNNTDAAIGVLTNGVVYKFFTDLDKPNIMDQSPFLEVDIRKADQSVVDKLKRFAKDSFDPEEIKTAAQKAAKDANVIRVAKANLERMYHYPDTEFSKMILRDVVDGRFTQKIAESHHELVKQAFHEFARDLSNTEGSSEFPQQTVAGGSQSDSTTGEWQSISDFQPRKGDVKPTQMMFPDNSEVAITTWNQVVTQAVRWLTNNGRLDASHCPIQRTTKRYLVAVQPIHPSGKEFTHAREVNSLHAELSYNLPDTIKNVKLIIERAGMDASQFKLRW